MTEYSILLVSRLDPLRYLFDRPVLTGRLMRWLVLLTEFDIQYVTQKSMKGSIVTDHLASLLVSDDKPISLMSSLFQLPILQNGACTLMALLISRDLALTSC